jgi:hypothetical protein
MYFHSHAIEQFITRYNRHLTYEQAQAMLERAARYKAETTRTGERYYDVPELGVRLIVKLWRGGEWNGEQVCITVVKGHYCQLLTDIELELLEEAAARAAPRGDRHAWPPPEPVRPRGPKRAA